MPGPSEISTIDVAVILVPSLVGGRPSSGETADDKSHASASLISRQTKEEVSSVFPFLKFPAEIRLQIYRHLLNDRRDIRSGKLRGDYAKLSKWRIERLLQKTRANEYYVTYQVHAINIHSAILSVNRQTYLEASRVLYSENQYTFDEFDYLRRWYPCAAMVPFLEDLSKSSRRLIKRIEFSYYENEESLFKQECAYLTLNLQLQHVTLRLYLEYDRHYESHLSNLDKQSWIQQLVPLVQNLVTFKLRHYDPTTAELIRPVQTYLESKMHDYLDTM